MDKDARTIVVFTVVSFFRGLLVLLVLDNGTRECGILEER